MKHSSFVSFGLVLGLMFDESFVRIIDHKLLSTEQFSSKYIIENKDDTRALAQYDPELGWIPNLGVKQYPGNQGVVTVLDGNIRSNENEVKYESTNPILTVGDSFTFGDQVNDRDSWPSALERKLKEKVVNGGVSGYGVDQMIMRAEKLVPKYHPKLLIVSLIPHDVLRVGMSMFGKPKPYYFMDGNTPVLQNVPVPIMEPYKIKNRSFIAEAFRKVFGYSYLADFTMSRINPYFWYNAPIPVGVQISGHQEIKNNPIAVSCALIKQKLVPLSKMTKVLVVIQHTRLLHDWEIKTGKDVEWCAKREGLEVLNFDSEFDGIKRDNPDYYTGLFRVRGGHMAPAGNEIVADRIGATIKEEGI